ncbi:hypothetical protein ACFZCP_40180 [Streptomyces sp. NPDC007971]|uniref:hypothetical protein n=1 Tax=Streptomyces sp. NPDC007971 TaxID=3364799 RepID=UPI0036E3E71B
MSRSHLPMSGWHLPRPKQPTRRAEPETAEEGYVESVTLPEDWSRGADAWVGARPYAEVERALDDLAVHGRMRSSQFFIGAAAAYEWALGRIENPPVTGRGGRGTLDLPQLTAELDEAAAILEIPDDQPGSLDFLRGVRTALAWVCGDDQVSVTDRARS